MSRQGARNAARLCNLITGNAKHYTSNTPLASIFEEGMPSKRLFAFDQSSERIETEKHAIASHTLKNYF
jgi:hypothetical protein